MAMARRARDGGQAAGGGQDARRGSVFVIVVIVSGDGGGSVRQRPRPPRIRSSVGVRDRGPKGGGEDGVGMWCG